MLPVYCRGTPTACVIGNVKNRSTKLGKENADADHKFSTTPPQSCRKVIPAWALITSLNTCLIGLLVIFRDNQRPDHNLYLYKVVGKNVCEEIVKKLITKKYIHIYEGKFQCTLLNSRGSIGSLC